MSMNRHSIFLAISLVIPCALPLSALAAGDAPPVTGIYSDMQLSPEEGDYVGAEVQLLESREGGQPRYHALVQFAEGEPAPPQLVDVTVKGSHVAFKAQYNGIMEVEFSGEVTDTALKGAFSGLAGETLLPRGNSIWQQAAGDGSGDEGEADAGDEIERQAAQCMEANYSSVGMSDCLEKEYAARDAQLNQTYRDLRARLSPEIQKALKASQLKWIEHRDLELRLIEGIFASEAFSGTIWVQVAQQMKNEVVKARVKALSGYVEQYKLAQ